MMDPLEESPVGQLGKLAERHLIPDRRGRDAGGEEGFDHLVPVAAGEPGGELPVYPVVMTAPARSGGQFGSRRPNPGSSMTRRRASQCPSVSTARATQRSSPAHW